MLYNDMWHSYCVDTLMTVSQLLKIDFLCSKLKSKLTLLKITVAFCVLHYNEKH